MNNIDFNKLREDLINYFGTAMSYFPLAIADLSKVENCSEIELLNIAEKNGFNIEEYKIQPYTR